MRLPSWEHHLLDTLFKETLKRRGRAGIPLIRITSENNMSCQCPNNLSKSRSHNNWKNIHNVPSKIGHHVVRNLMCLVSHRQCSRDAKLHKIWWSNISPTRFAKLMSNISHCSVPTQESQYLLPKYCTFCKSRFVIIVSEISNHLPSNVCHSCVHKLVHGAQQALS